MNKKFLGIASALALSAIAGVSCAKSETYVYFGLGNYASASAKTVAAGNTVQSDIYAAAVLFDQEGKIVDANIDVMQAVVKAASDSAIATNVPTKMNAGTDFKSKWELGDAYGMKGFSAISKEWYEQMNAYENWIVGKTIADVKGAGYKVANASHTYVLTNDAIKTSVSITTEGYLNVIERAWNNRVAVKVAKVADVRLGLGMLSALAAKQINVTIGGAIFGKDDKVLAARHDVYQVPVSITLRADSNPAVYDVAVEITNKKQIAVGGTTTSAVILSKHDLGPVYGMYYQAATTVDKATVFFNGKVYERKGTTGAGEWYEQANAFVSYLVGKKVSDVELNISATTNKFNDGVLASVTITVNEYAEVYAEAFEVAQSTTR